MTPSEPTWRASGCSAPNREYGSPPKTSPSENGSIQVSIPRSVVAATSRRTESACHSWSNSVKVWTTYVQPAATMSSRSGMVWRGARPSKYATPSSMVIGPLRVGDGGVVSALAATRSTVDSVPSCRAANGDDPGPLTPIGFAHRGASALAPENTLEAFRLAVELGATGLESDVHVSKDGVAILVHDPRFEVDGEWLAIRDLPADTLESMGMPRLASLYALVGTALPLSLDLNDADPLEAADAVVDAASDGRACGGRWVAPVPRRPTRAGAPPRRFATVTLVHSTAPRYMGSPEARAPPRRPRHRCHQPHWRDWGDDRRRRRGDRGGPPRRHRGVRLGHPAARNGVEDGAARRRRPLRRRPARAARSTEGLTLGPPSSVESRPLRCRSEHRSRLSSDDRGRTTGRRRGARDDDRRRRRPRVSRCGGRGHRRQCRARPCRDRGGHGRPGGPPRLRAR